MTCRCFTGRPVSAIAGHFPGVPDLTPKPLGAGMPLPLREPGPRSDHDAGVARARMAVLPWAREKNGLLAIDAMDPGKEER